ncbi:hypothetical protein HanXRQr2_Chr09g0376461 [Helianthus annuus]|uniref:Uncharacterized protein n=1 Tax=Helianthus annuus TaxID=4232 RepID=A0A9K3I4C0_HELAN|nr:hypothetical protein HanXRQr2_Chr09g0376461 [Helianthus annuus]KAJ0892189.1 hypothetical protein HanPSC8_Chr09g0362941 [Helianthus annuus]
MICLKTMYSAFMIHRFGDLKKFIKMEDYSEMKAFHYFAVNGKLAVDYQRVVVRGGKTENLGRLLNWKRACSSQRKD